MVALRAAGQSREAEQRREKTFDTRRRGFAGLIAAQYARAQQQGLLPAGEARPADLRQHCASAPIVVRAILEGIQPVDRGDGLSLDYLYRVRESWRGERKAGDVLIVRMPPLGSKSRSPLITPEPGAEVLLLASRPGYITSRLIEGFPPSTDLRVVAMTLPLMRVTDGKLVEAASSADVMGAASFAGTTLDDARALARQVDAQMRTIASPSPTSLRRYYIRRIGSRELPDPTRLWIEYDDSLNVGNPRGYGAVTAYFDGCSTVTRQVPMASAKWTRGLSICASDTPVGPSAVNKPVEDAVRWIEANGFPYTMCILIGPCSDNQGNIVPLPGAEIELREMLR